MGSRWLRIRWVSLDVIYCNGIVTSEYSLLSSVPGSEHSEMLHHCSWAYEKFSSYIGCEDIVENALEIIFSINLEESSAKPLPFIPDNDSPQKLNYPWTTSCLLSLFPCNLLPCLGKKTSGFTRVFGRSGSCDEEM